MFLYFKRSSIQNRPPSFLFPIEENTHGIDAPYGFGRVSSLGLDLSTNGSASPSTPRLLKTPVGDFLNGPHRERYRNGAHTPKLALSTFNLHSSPILKKKKEFAELGTQLGFDQFIPVNPIEISDHYQLLDPFLTAGTVTTDTLLEFNSPLAQILLLDILTELKGTFFADSPSTFSDYLNSVNLPEISVKGFETLMTYFICESPNVSALNSHAFTKHSPENFAAVTEHLKQSQVLSDCLFPIRACLNSDFSDFEGLNLDFIKREVNDRFEKNKKVLAKFHKYLRRMLFGFSSTSLIEGDFKGKFKNREKDVEPFLNAYIDKTVFSLIQCIGSLEASLSSKNRSTLQFDMKQLNQQAFEDICHSPIHRCSSAPTFRSDEFLYDVHPNMPTSSTLWTIKAALKFGSLFWDTQHILKNIETFEKEGLGGLVHKYYATSEAMVPIPIPYQELYLLTDPTSIAHIFKHKDRFTRAPYSLIDRLFPNNVFTKSGKAHDMTIRNMMPYLHTKDLPEIVDRCTQEMIKDQLDDGRFEDILKLFQSLTWDIISKYSLGLESFKNQADSLGTKINQALQAIVKAIVFPSLFDAQVERLIDECRIDFYEAVMSELDDLLNRRGYIRDVIFYEIIQDVLLTFSPSGQQLDVENRLKETLISFKDLPISDPESHSLPSLLKHYDIVSEDLKSLVISNRFKGSNYADRFEALTTELGHPFMRTLLTEYIDLSTYSTSTTTSLFDAIMFLFAGHETTGLALSWLMINLSKHSDFLDIVVNEIRSNPSIPTDASIYTYPTLFPNLTLAIHESFRTSPPSWAAARAVVNSGQKIPTSNNGELTPNQGDILVVPLHKISTDPKYWGQPTNVFEQPRSFNPYSHFRIKDGKAIESPNVYLDDLFDDSIVKKALKTLMQTRCILPFFTFTKAIDSHDDCSFLETRGLDTSVKNELITSLKEYFQTDYIRSIPFYLELSCSNVANDIISQLMARGWIESVEYKLSETFTPSDLIRDNFQISDVSFNKMSERLYQLSLSKLANQPFISGNYACKGKDVALMELYRITVMILKDSKPVFDKPKSWVSDLTATNKPINHESSGGCFKPIERRRSNSFSALDQLKFKLVDDPLQDNRGNSKDSTATTLSLTEEAPSRSSKEKFEDIESVPPKPSVFKCLRNIFHPKPK